ncbi:nitroreductase [Chishuiella sp.]|uniref:nitroreductase family protein n=1 Tax=Chishuiella sp. TaxID=1969467 RepID=UPI0028AA1ECE|nr:nitroreductase [Chishuiella sp.]
MNAKDLLSIIKKRRSVFPPQYTQEEITKEELSLIFEAANWAPSHKKTEPWRFVVLEGPAKDRFREYVKRVYVQGTPTDQLSDRKINSLIEKCDKSNKIVLINFINTEKNPEWEELAAVSMAVQNMWLMATELNVGAYWSSPANVIANMDEFTPMDEGEKCVGVFYMGKFDGELPEGIRKPVEEKVKFLDY